MARSKEAFNPFYAALVVVGTAFAITAFAYGVMSVRQLHEGRRYQPTQWAEIVATEASVDSGSPGPAPHHPESAAGVNLMNYLNQHGARLMAGELLLLAVLMFAAMGTDRFWTRRAQRLAATSTPGSR